MPVTITLDCESYEEAIAILQVARVITTMESSDRDEEVTEEVREESVVVAQPAAAADDKAAAVAATPTLEEVNDMLEAIRAGLVKAVQARSNGDTAAYEAATKIFADFGCGKVSDISDTQVFEIFKRFSAAALL